ncbi:uncharacterized protein VP01_1633g4 [Puccinia sorghi]|uniref:Uncharacterized protein n=1 Tax=Puccinia sorghi TaxID=27349 RepID=A0A0L6VGW6_9BASI|nr:uncharacterized protein VP01_1633g4 [Puccinia sorghi]
MSLNQTFHITRLNLLWERALPIRRLRIFLIEEMLPKIALLCTVDDNMKVGVAESLSGLAGFRLISDMFFLRSRTHHIATMKQLLDIKFNHLDHAANLDTHFWKIENMVKNLFWSGFVLSKESFIGLFFHLSLPNLESFPFINVARQLDLSMEQGDNAIRNVDILCISNNEITFFRNIRRLQTNLKVNRPSSTHGTTTTALPSNVVVKWCHKCKFDTHYIRPVIAPNHLLLAPQL